jgi:predicted O-methyltransferase YrrM
VDLGEGSHPRQAAVATSIEDARIVLTGAHEVTGGPVDFMLIDIWVEMALPALELVAPRLRPGAVVIADNTTAVRESYRAYFKFLADPKNGFRTQTLPFEGGLELSVQCA